MILDDHDIVDGFANDRALPTDPPRPHASYLEAARQAYQEYVHLRHPSQQPDGPLYYDFQYGSARFFVLDTRTDRYLRKEQMIDPEQMEALKSWLKEHKEQLKFVVSSIAFVAEVRPDRERKPFESRDDSAADPASEERIDKWCGRPYRRQREEILRFVLDHEIGRLVFLVGDMHCAYHATMRVGYVGHGLMLHELAGGPVYQLRFASRRDFYDQCRGTITSGRRSYPYATSLRRIQGGSSSVLHISASSSEICWKIVPTTGRVEPPPDMNGPVQAAAWDGRISF
jgi:alkaline phosphatase D